MDVQRHWIAYLGEPTIEGNHILETPEEAERYDDGGWSVAGPFIAEPPQAGAVPCTSTGAVEARELVEATRGLLHALQWGDADQLRVARMEASEAVRVADHPEGAVSDLGPALAEVEKAQLRGAIPAWVVRDLRRVADLQREVVRLQALVDDCSDYAP